MQVTISAEGEIVIPKELVARLNFGPGANVEVEVLGRGLIVKPAVPAEPRWKRMRGMFADCPEMLEDLIRERRQERAAEDAR